MNYLMVKKEMVEGFTVRVLLSLSLFLVVALSSSKLVQANNLHDHLRGLAVAKTQIKNEQTLNKAPDIHGVTLRNNSYDFNGSSEKPLVLMFADSLCPLPHFPGCEQKIAEFNRLEKKYRDKVNWLQVIKGYYVDKAHVQGYLKDFAITAPSIWDTDNKIFTDYQVFANPYIVVINPQGDVVFRRDVFISELENQLMSLLN